MKNKTMHYYALTACIIGSIFIAALSISAPSFGKKCNCGTCAAAIQDCSNNTCACISILKTGRGWENGRPTTLEHMYAEFVKHEKWLVETVFGDHVLPSMMMMTNQISTLAMQQMQIIGTFFDAKHQLETQRLLQDLQAQAHKEYHPSTGMCRFGTNVRSLAASDSLVSFNQLALASRNTQRILMAGGSIGTGSARDDSKSRLAQFRKTYCNPKDFGNALDLLCDGGDIERRNKDINYTHNIQDEDTLLLDLTNTDVTKNEEDVFALSANLYGNRLLPKIPGTHMADKSGKIVDNGAKAYMKTRALAAKRSVAFNSFAAQVALKSEGRGEVLPYITEVLKDMGVPDKTIKKMLKEKPSYHAQMEFLSKKLYQYPNFYSDLYDKPVNIDRKDVSMQAIALMQKRDMYRSQLRSEANMAVWLETLLEDLQEYHTNEAEKVSEKDNKIILNLGL